LNADATVVDLHRQPYYYHVGQTLTTMSYAERERERGERERERRETEKLARGENRVEQAFCITKKT
jgi:hypothetical protein